MNLSGLLSDSFSCVVALVKDVEAGIAKNSGDGIVGNSVDIAEALLGDEAFKASLAALVKDIMG